MLRDGAISTDWNSELAYVVGLITSDGNLSSDGRHINITSKDRDLLETARTILQIRNVIGRKSRGFELEKKYFCLQFGSVNFYNFLLSIGLTPAKSKTMGSLAIPEAYFPDFLRGCIDGDGSIIETSHPESQYTQLRVSLSSASIDFLSWVHSRIKAYFEITGGWIYTFPNGNCSLLSFGKADSITILNLIYGDPDSPRLGRKFAKAEGYLENS